MNWDSTVSIEEVGDILEKAGILKKDIELIFNLRQEILPKLSPRELAMFLNDPTYKEYLARAIKDFDFPELIKKYVSYDDKGNPTISKENRLRLSKEIVKYYYIRIHANTSQFFREAKDSQIDYYLAGLRGLIAESLGRLEKEIFKGEDDLSKELRRFLSDRINRFQASILTYAEIFHDLPLYARDVSSFEKWPEFLGRLFPSEMGEAFYGDHIMELTRAVIGNYLRKRIVLNKGGKIPTDLFSREFNDKEIRYSHKDAENIKRLIVNQLKFLGIEYEDWEIDRAFNYALGIGLASMIDPELIATANPNIDNEFRGIYPLASHMAAKHNWGLGRGFPGANIVPELMVFDQTMFPEERSFLGRIFKKKRN